MNMKGFDCLFQGEKKIKFTKFSDIFTFQLDYGNNHPQGGFLFFFFVFNYRFLMPTIY